MNNLPKRIKYKGQVYEAVEPSQKRYLIKLTRTANGKTCYIGRDTYICANPKGDNSGIGYGYYPLGSEEANEVIEKYGFKTKARAEKLALEYKGDPYHTNVEVVEVPIV